MNYIYLPVYRRINIQCDMNNINMQNGTCWKTYCEAQNQIHQHLSPYTYAFCVELHVIMPVKVIRCHFAGIWTDAPNIPYTKYCNSQ